MTDWLAFRSAVEAAVFAAMPSAVSAPANNDGPTIYWQDGAHAHGKHKLALSIVADVNEVDRDSALNIGGDQELSTLKLTTIQIQAESQYDTGDVDARWLIEQVRLGLRRVSVRETLAALNINIASFPGAVTGRSYPADDRMVSACSFDVQLRWVLTFDSGESAGLIEHVVAEGEDGLDGVDISVDDPDPEP